MRALVVNARDYEALAGFWQQLLGVGVAVREQDWVQLETGPAGVYLAFQPMAEGDAPGVHIRPDIEVADIATAQARIIELGGSLVRVVQEADGDEHRVMADPEGNEFCILPPLPPELRRHLPGDPA
jgi:predicted enzyme related to lactoylglutathione lyase